MACPSPHALAFAARQLIARLHSSAHRCAGVRETEQLPAGRERKVLCLIAGLWYNAKMSHRESCSTFLCLQPTTQCSLCVSSAARSWLWQLHCCGTSLDTNGTSPGFVSLHKQSRSSISYHHWKSSSDVCELNPWKGNISWLICSTKVSSALEFIDLNHYLNSVWSWEMHSTPEMWWFPTSHSCGMLHFHPSFSRDVYDPCTAFTLPPIRLCGT